MENKSSLKIYKENNEKIGGVDYNIYDNSIASVVLFQDRANSLPLYDPVHFLREDSKCPVCGAETVNLEHLLLWCSGHEEEKKKNLLLQQPFQENKEQVVDRFLFEFHDKSEVDSVKEVFCSFWKIRERKLKTSD